MMLGGCVLLGVVLGSPAFTARRAARVESRAEDAARALFELAVEAAPEALSAEPTRTDIATTFVAACRELGHPTKYLPKLRPMPAPLVADSTDGLAFASRHYCFLLTRGARRQPVDQDSGATSRPGAASSPSSAASEFGPLQVYAWPVTLSPPGHSAFYFGEDDAPAFSRNLMHQYVGWDEDRDAGRRIPRPDSGTPRRDYGTLNHYRGRDDERWLLLR